MVSPAEWVTGNELLDFAGIAPARVATLPLDQQFAEKAHAYTLSRTNPNTRVKDLVDMVLILDRYQPEPSKVARAVQATFATRKTHDIPEKLLAPPEEWKEPYATMAQEAGLILTDIQLAYTLVVRFWEMLEVEARRV